MQYLAWNYTGVLLRFVATFVFWVSDIWSPIMLNYMNTGIYELYWLNYALYLSRLFKMYMDFEVKNVWKRHKKQGWKADGTKFDNYNPNNNSLQFEQHLIYKTEKNL